MPAEPKQYWRLIGPGIIAAGVGLASGEFILYPYIASQVGLVFVWAALVGVVTQFFINMEIERYTLATGETALTGFSRYWRHWGLVFALLTFLANAWPGLGHQLGHHGHLHLRRREREAAGRAGRDRDRPDHGPGGLHHGRAHRVLQGLHHPVLHRGRHRHRHHR